MVILGLEPADFGHWHCNVTLNDGKSINESRVLAERSDGARMVSMSQFKSTVHHHQFKEKQHHHENINADYNDYQEAYTENEYEDAVQFPQFRTLKKTKELSLDTNQNSTERPKDTPSLTSLNEEYDKPSVGGENEALREYDVVHTLLGDEEAFKEYKKNSEQSNNSDKSNHTILITPL